MPGLIWVIYYILFLFLNNINFSKNWYFDVSWSENKSFENKIHISGQFMIKFHENPWKSGPYSITKYIIYVLNVIEKEKLKSLKSILHLYTKKFYKFNNMKFIQNLSIICKYFEIILNCLQGINTNSKEELQKNQH